MQISLNEVAIEFGATLILSDVSLTVSRGDRWGIIGRNGSGKTSLLNVMAGRQPPSRGSVARAGGLRITLLDQHREFPPATTVWQAAAAPFEELMALERSLEQQGERLASLGSGASPELLTRYDRDLDRFAREGGYTFGSRVAAVLDGLGFDPVQAAELKVDQLSGGEQSRIALARQLVAPADVLMLDEPTNHLDLETTRWLENYLNGLDASVLLISHDRAFLENVVDHVLHLENLTATAYYGSYSAFVHQRAERRLTMERAFDTQQKKIAAEEDYIRRNIAGQNSQQAKGRRTRLGRLERLSPPPTDRGAMSLRLDGAVRGGDQVLVAKDVRLTIGERTLITGFSARISRADVVGLVGANGTGKSTLLRAITGEGQLERGELQVGESIVPAYYRQDMTQVPSDKSLFDIVHDLRPQWDRGQVQSHLGRFGFSGVAVQRSADTLSGGERARVALAMMVLARANFLLLDEPTNHLDVESIEALEDALEDYPGTVLLVSHDRALLRGTVTRVWSLEDSRITDYPGTFEEWERWHDERAVAAARATRDAEKVRQEQQRLATRRREESGTEQRARLRTLRTAANSAEEEVHRLEERLAELKAELEDPQLYATPEGARSAVTLKAELDDADEELVLALERWTNATEAVQAQDA